MSNGASGASAATLARVLAAYLVPGVLVAALCAGFYWLVRLYADGLRDPRYLDGWVLAGGVALQVGFHVATQSGRLSPSAAARLRSFHIVLGFLLIAVIISHSDFTLPDSGFEWALWSAFALITLSGAVSTYLSRSLQAKRGDERVGYDRISSRRTELAREVLTAVATASPAADTTGLPATPYDAWIADLYSNHLRNFFDEPPSLGARLAGSQKARLERLTDEIDNLSRYLDASGRQKLEAIKKLVLEKDALDFASVNLGVARACQLVHVPLAYALVVLTTLHVLVVYAFSSGDW